MLSTDQTINPFTENHAKRKNMGPLHLLHCCYSLNPTATTQLLLYLFSIIVTICFSFSICRKCLYDANVTKYLVLVKDDVEAGDERLKEFEQELQDMGLLDTQFSLGDLLDEGRSREHPRPTA